MRRETRDRALSDMGREVLQKGKSLLFGGIHGNCGRVDSEIEKKKKKKKISWRKRHLHSVDMLV